MKSLRTLLSTIFLTTSTKSTSMDDLASIQRDLLILVAEEPKVDVEIKSEMEDYYGSDIADGRLFPNLDVLVEKGYITKYDSDRAPRTNEYQITEKGKEVIAKHRQWRLSYL